MMLFRKMRKFGLSDSLISSVKADLNKQKIDLINNNKLKPETIEAIRKSEEIYLKNGDFYA